ncbi:MAG: DUF971 domain-containing protein [Ignavibacteriaceae bacterium]|nr:DUF971 domain-containing protein [Ignavibacteriaceae bacterium]
MKPLAVSISEKKNLLIQWDDGTNSQIELRFLRRYCPCATCSEQRESQSKSYIPLFFADQVKVKSISEVGNYAIGITWRDGHNTGIYEFPYLKFLAQSNNAV